MSACSKSLRFWKHCVSKQILFKYFPLPSLERQQTDPLSYFFCLTCFASLLGSCLFPWHIPAALNQLQCAGLSSFSRPIQQLFQNWGPAREAPLDCPQQHTMEERWKSGILPGASHPSTSIFLPREGSYANDGVNSSQQWERWIPALRIWRKQLLQSRSLFFSDRIPKKALPLTPWLGKGGKGYIEKLLWAAMRRTFHLSHLRVFSLPAPSQCGLRPVLLQGSFQFS